MFRMVLLLMKELLTFREKAVLLEPEEIRMEIKNALEGMNKNYI